MIAVGIDPGVAGGIVALRGSGDVLLTSKMPPTNEDILSLLQSIVAMRVPGSGASFVAGATIEPIHAVLENVHSMPKQGIASAFTFGQGFGALRMALVATKIPYDLVVPRKWQPLVGVIYPKRSEGESRDKNVTKARAQELFPNVKVTHALADALLIAEACRRWHAAKGL